MRRCIQQLLLLWPRPGTGPRATHKGAKGTARVQGARARAAGCDQGACTAARQLLFGVGGQDCGTG